MIRVIAYIDGLNLYFGLKEKGWKRFYWLNVQKMVLGLLKPGQELVKTKYFSSIVKEPQDKRKRQQAFLEALETLGDMEIQYGHFLSDQITCFKCGAQYAAYHEKQTDVNISVAMLVDAYDDRFDDALLVSADSDLVGPIRALQTIFPKKRVTVAFPPARFSKELAKTTSYTHIGRDVLARSLFADQVIKADGYVLVRPQKWS